MRVLDRFDAGLMLPDNPDAREIDFTGIGTLAPGARTEATRQFNVMQAGRLCHNVSVTCAEGATDSTQFCVTASQPSEERVGRVEVTKIAGASAGPVVATVGETVRFRVTVKNTGDLPLVDVRVIDEYPPAFFRVLPPPDVNVVSGVITRTIERLERGAQQTFDVDAQCLQAGMPVIPKPLVRVTASTDPPTQQIPSANEVDMEIRPANPAAEGAGAGATGAPAGGARAPLTVVTSFLPKPARIGSVTTCEVSVVNALTVDDENMEVRVVLPPQLTPVMNSIRAPRGVRVSLNGPQLSFTPVATLRPTERVIYSIPLSVSGPAGFGEVVTDVRSRSMPSGAPRRDTLEIGNLQ